MFVIGWECLGMSVFGFWCVWIYNWWKTYELMFSNFDIYFNIWCTHIFCKHIAQYGCIQRTTLFSDIPKHWFKRIDQMIMNILRHKWQLQFVNLIFYTFHFIRFLHACHMHEFVSHKQTCLYNAQSFLFVRVGESILSGRFKSINFGILQSSNGGQYHSLKKWV